MNFDPRITPARPDLAAKEYEGEVTAERFVEGELRQVMDAQAPVRQHPRPDAPMVTEALMGEEVMVYEFNDEGWAWGQLASDRYVGWLPTNSLRAPLYPSHKITALRTFVFPGPSIKEPPVISPPFGSRLAATEGRVNRLTVTHLGFVPMDHLAPLDRHEHDFVAVAQRFLGTPYLWGGKTNYGIDCSGLVQVALNACGFACPRDSDMQEAALGRPVALGDIKHGDLVFWKGHVAFAFYNDALLHANAFHMAVVIEPLAKAIARIKAAGSEVTSVRRLS